MSKNLFLVAAKRTPFGAFGGALKDLTATDLATHASKAALAAGKVDPNIVDSVIFGNVSQTSSDATYLSRHVGLRSGVPIPTPALTVNRLCGSGFQSIVNACHEILLGESSVVLAGGTENMSQAPYAVRGIRFGTQLGKNPPFEDTLWAGLVDSYVKTPMAITAENLAEQYKLSREECDTFALRSQLNWVKGNKEGVFDAEIAPIPVKTRKGHEDFKVDEGPRPNSTMEGLAKLKPVFKENGVVTAGNASGITDGAAAVVVASEEAVKKHGLTPLARIVSWQSAGVDPKIMGIGPVPAIKGALARAKLDLKQMDLVEVNEAFASQVLAVAKELGIDHEKLNIHGGAISLGHPLGASGARITAHLAHLLHKSNLKYAVGSACIGGGQGIAIILEKA